MARRFRQLIGDRRCSSTPSWSRERPHSRGRERTHAKDEFLSAAATQNLRKLAKLIPFPVPAFATWGGEVRLCPLTNAAGVNRLPNRHEFFNIG